MEPRDYPGFIPDQRLEGGLSQAEQTDFVLGMEDAVLRPIEPLWHIDLLDFGALKEEAARLIDDKDPRLEKLWHILFRLSTASNNDNRQELESMFRSLLRKTTEKPQVLPVIFLAMANMGDSGLYGERLAGSAEVSPIIWAESFQIVKEMEKPGEADAGVLKKHLAAPSGEYHNTIEWYECEIKRKAGSGSEFVKAWQVMLTFISRSKEAGKAPEVIAEIERLVRKCDRCLEQNPHQLITIFNQDAERWAKFLDQLIAAAPEQAELWQSLRRGLDLEAVRTTGGEALNWGGYELSFGKPFQDTARVRTLTMLGVVGLFDEQNKFIGYFELPRGARAGKSLAINSQSGHLSAFSEGVNAKFYEIICGKFSSETQLEFNRLTLEQQGKLVDWCLNGDTEQLIKTFLQTRGYRGLSILTTIAETAGDAKLVAKLFIINYDEIGQTLATCFEIVQHLHDIDEYSKELGIAASAGDVVRELVGRARKFIEKIVSLSATISPRHGSTTVFSERGVSIVFELMKLVENVSADSQFFASAYKSAAAAGVPPEFGKIKGVSVESASMADLGETREGRGDLAAMQAIFSRNRQSYPPACRAQREEEFAHLLGSEGQEKARWYILRHNKKIIAFLRLVDKEPGKKYLGSVNVAPEMQSSAIGGAFLDSVLAREGADAAIRADVKGDNPMLRHYVDQLGFRIVETIDNFRGSGLAYAIIERPPTPAE